MNLGVGANCCVDAAWVAWKRKDDEDLVVVLAGFEVTNRCGDGVCCLVSALL